jgi:hypothetical protein
VGSVTVLEIVSPRNKAALGEILDYQERRGRLLARRVNVVEIDLTRSVKRLVEDTIAATHAYHLAIHLPGQVGRFVGIEFEEAPGRLALPLREAVLPVEVGAAYAAAYQRAALAVQIRRENRYAVDGLPFPSLLSNAQQAATLQAVQDWLAELARLAGAE